MYAVTVTFTLHQEHMDAFLPLMMQNAKTSLSDEAGCHQFDVCTDPARPNQVFLYELYDDAEAFQTHMGTPHFKAFDAVVAPMVAGKEVRLFRTVAQ